MALTITRSPLTLLPSLQPVVLEVKSDSTEPGLRIKGVCDEGADSVPAVPNVAVRFEMSDYLKVLFPALAPITANTPQYFAHAPLSVNFQFFELYGSPVSEHNEINSDVYYAMLAKVPESKRIQFYKDYTGLYDYLLATKSFLTWWPVTEFKKQVPGFPDFIYYLQLASGSTIDITLDITVTFTDNTSHTMPSPFSAIAADPLRAYYVPVGYDQLGIASWMAANFPNDAVKEYSIVLKNGTTAVSALYKYALDDSYYSKVRQLWFRNPYGFYDTLLLTGSGKITSESKPDRADINAIDLPGKINWKNTTNRNTAASTGWLSKPEINWLADLVDTIEVYEYISGTLHPVVMNDIQIIPEHDNDYQFKAELQWEYAPVNYAEKI